MINITWKVKQLEAMEQDPLSGVIVTVCFEVKGEEDGKQGFSSGDTKLSPPDSSSFTALSSCTEEQVIAWTKAALGESGVKMFEDRVREQIGWQKVPQPRTVALPWAPGNSQDL